ncbi:hypothetical protein BG006_010810 [Podila minutissima]|uniref:G domain-containing protein n=1 Tax=Podila minutissima TaxID=64525 RepID=A0A9P5SCQ4_9FUNG|nr:hypothetical protein BG006_010810 [Podila minutissima]
MTAILLLGNAGAGKSTLLTQLGGTKFKAGVHFRKGFTKSIEQEQVTLSNGQTVMLIDVPGLFEPDDAATMVNASVLNVALKMDFEFKIFFVMTANNRGPQDREMVMMSKINECIKTAAGSRVSFRLIVNQIMSDDVYKMYEHHVAKDNCKTLFKDLDIEGFSFDIKIDSVMLLRFDEVDIYYGRFREKMEKEVYQHSPVVIKMEMPLAFSNEDLNMYAASFRAFVQKMYNTGGLFRGAVGAMSWLLHPPGIAAYKYVKELESGFSSSMRDQIHSVLVLGKSQSGKTALIQHIKNYEAEDYIIDQSLLGDGTFSKTGTTRPFPVKSCLPSYEAFQKRTGQVINLKDLGVEYKDDEDYQDLLLSSETDVGLRFAPEGFDKPLLDAVEFEFVDTPGLCNHEDRDSSHALDVIDKIVTTRSFSLVLIVINSHDPLSAELLLAFQYYAEILGDLCNKIAFVFTHVDYLHSRLNTNQNLALEEKLCLLSRIFKGSVAGEIEPFPSFAIDLSQKKQPVVQCMIRNTLKDILQLAISRPATMVDTSTKNVQRVNRIPHPSNFDNKKRMAALDHIHGELDPRTKVNMQEKKTSRRSTPEDVNILLIGDVQSGKTSLLETMKMYAEAGSVFNEELVVLGSNGIPDEVMQVASFAAEFHTLEIRALSNGRHHIVNIEEDARTLHPDAFESLLNMGQGNVVTRHIPPSVSKEYRFSVFEAPGFHNDAEDPQGLQRKVLAIYRTIVESQTDIHHILVTLAPDSITTITKAFITLLTEMFVNIQPHISFVHTKIDYSQLHWSNEQFHNSVNRKKMELQQQLLQPSLPTFMIDNSQYADRPIKRAISQNAIRKILQTTMSKRPDCSVLTLVKPKYSVLVLGQTQSGKSTLVQHIKKYANPSHEIDQSFLGNGNVSKTLSTTHFSIDSNLPAYEVQRNNDRSIVNLQDLQFKNEDDYHELIEGREKDYTLRISQDPQYLPSQLIEFQFLDTPGLNDTDQRDTIFADNIIKGIIKTRTFNLILIIVSVKCSLSQEFGFALEYYSNVLQGLHANMAFLHTHVNYADCHYSNTKHHDNMAARHRVFSNIFRDCAYTPNPHNTVEETTSMDIDSPVYRRFTIDMHKGKRPIVQCLIRNTLREILKLAVDNVPVDLDTSDGNIARINGLVHPDKANQEYRDRFRKAKSVAMP